MSRNRNSAQRTKPLAHITAPTMLWALREAKKCEARYAQKKVRRAPTWFNLMDKGMSDG